MENSFPRNTTDPQLLLLLEENRNLKAIIQQKTKKIKQKDKTIQELQKKLFETEVSEKKVKELEKNIKKLSNILDKLETKNRGMIVIEGLKTPQKKTNKIDEKFQKIKERIDEEKTKLSKSKENPSKYKDNAAKSKLLNILNKENQLLNMPETPQFGKIKNKVNFSVFYPSEKMKKISEESTDLNKTFNITEKERFLKNKKKEYNLYGISDFKRERIISSPTVDELLRMRKCYSRDENK